MSPPRTVSTCQPPASHTPMVTPPRHRHPASPARFSLFASFLSNSPEGQRALGDPGLSLGGASCQWVRWQVRGAGWLRTMAPARTSTSSRVPSSRCSWAHDSTCSPLLFLAGVNSSRWPPSHFCSVFRALSQSWRQTTSFGSQITHCLTWETDR